MSELIISGELFIVDVKEEWIEDAKDFFSKTHAQNVKFQTEDLP